MGLVYEFRKVFNWSCFADWLNFFHKNKFLFKSFEVDFSSCDSFHIPGILPLITHINYYRRQGYKFNITLPSSASHRNLFSRNGWTDYLYGNFSKSAISNTNSGLIHFTDYEDVNKAVNSVLEITLKNARFKPGVLEGIEWTVNELIDNVLNHSDSMLGGFTQCIYYPKTKRIAVVVVDCGRGVLKSIKEAYPKTPSDISALNLAIQKGITRNKKVGQGNGLAGSINIVRSNQGHFLIHSGYGALLMGNKDKEPRPTTTAHFNGTVLDVEFQTENEISVENALWGNKPFTYLQSKYENSEGDIIYIISDDEKNLGNRKTGAFVRNKIINLLNSNPDKNLIVDFVNINVISSSFADEAIAKTMIEWGIDKFKTKVKIVNANNLILTTIGGVIKQRLEDT